VPRSALELSDLHMEGLYVLDVAGRIESRTDPDAPAPPFHLVRTAEGDRWLLRAGLPDELNRSLEAAAGGAGFERTLAKLDAVRDALREHVEPGDEWRGPAFAFPPTSFRSSLGPMGCCL